MRNLKNVLALTGIAVVILIGTQNLNAGTAYAFFSLKPEGISGLAKFENQQKQVSGDFGFAFDQTAIAGTKVFGVTVNIDSVDIKDSFNATRHDPLAATAQEAVIAFFMVKGVGLRIYKHSATESYAKIEYSIPVIAGSKTFFLKTSFARLNTLGDPVTYGESHRYDPNQTAFTPMVFSGGGILPGYSLPSNIWSTPNVVGIAKTTGIVWFHPHGMVSALLLNSEVDVSIK